MAIEAVIFDMDGLLIDTEPEWQRLEIEIFKGLGFEITGEMQRETFGLRVDEQVMHWFNQNRFEKAEPEAIINKLENLMHEYFLSDAQLMDGAWYIIDFFKAKELKMALASSSSFTLINAFIKKFGMSEVFEVAHSAEKEKYGKPNPAVYLSTAEALRTPPSSCLAFEDSFNGLLAAKSAKMKTVIVPPEKHFGDRNLSITDLKIRSLMDFTERDFLSL